MTALEVGDTAPDFTLPRSGGGTIALSDLRGRSIVLYFYPKDDTRGCTKEACNFRDQHVDIVGAQAIVLGVSPDSVAAHDRFAEKYNLPFALLADSDHHVAEAYGVWMQKSLYGRTYMGIERSTFLIGTDGTIRKIWRSVKPDMHVKDVLDALQPT